MNLKLKILLLLTVCFGIVLNRLFESKPIDPNIVEDSILTVPELIQKYGYTPEIHHATTEDGFILEIHRIASSPKFNETPDLHKKVVLLMHGFPSSSADWIITGPNIALGYYLSDLGYDVWMGNVRGNRYSKNHLKYSPTESKFWDFSFHEMGVIDVPTIIDYILEQTNEQKLTYIGFSQGVAIFYVMCSDRPEYMDKISHMHSLAPVANLHRTESSLLRMVSLYSRLPYISELMYEFLPHSWLIPRISKTLCNPDSIMKNICSYTLFMMYGYNQKQMNHTFLPIFFGHLPAGSSNKVFVHFGQLVYSDRFTQFNYGDERNLEIYGSTIPPNYNITGIHVPIAIHSSSNDVCMHPNDIKNVSESLPNVIDLFMYSDDQFNHVDFVTAIDVRKLVYTKVVEVMGRYA